MLCKWDASIITSLLHIITSLLHRPLLLPIISHFSPSLQNLQMQLEKQIPNTWILKRLAVLLFNTKPSHLTIFNSSWQWQMSSFIDFLNLVVAWGQFSWLASLAHSWWMPSMPQLYTWEQSWQLFKSSIVSLIWDIWLYPLCGLWQYVPLNIKDTSAAYSQILAFHGQSQHSIRGHNKEVLLKEPMQVFHEVLYI